MVHFYDVARKWASPLWKTSSRHCCIHYWKYFLQHSLGLTSEKTTSVLSPALAPGFLGSSGSESLGSKWQATWRTMRWNEACQALWRPLCMMYHWPDRREIPVSGLWHPIRVIVYFSEDPAALSGLPAQPKTIKNISSTGTFRFIL